MRQPTLEVQREQQPVRLDVAWDVDRLTVTVVEVNRREVDAFRGHCLTDAVEIDRNSIEIATFGIDQNASCRIFCMM